MKHVLLTGTAVAAVLSAAVATAQDRTGWPESFTVGTASQGGTFFVYGSGWANLVAEDLGITGAGEVTGGPMQNMALVHTGQVAFGLTTLGPAAESLAGNNPIAPGVAMDMACAIFPMYQTPFSIATLARPASPRSPRSPRARASASARRARPPTPTSRRCSKRSASRSSVGTAAGTTWAARCRTA